MFEDIHNHIYANDGLSSEQALEETIKILFLKIFDEKNKTLEFKISTSEYEHILVGEKEKFFSKRLEDLQKNTFSYFSNLFEKDEKIKLKESTIAFVFNKLQNVDLLNSSGDIKGLAFQKFLHSSQRVGRGQFFTPEQIIKLCVDIMQPTSSEKVLDLACGSGGFLSAALQYVSLNEPKKINNFAKDNIFGIEINRTAAKIAKMRMILEGDGYSNIIQFDSLSDWSDLNLELNKSNGSTSGSYQEYFDIILTNPPFGTQGKITDKSVLRNFDLGYKWKENEGTYTKSNTQLNGQVPEILFIERSLQFLKPGGRMAIVLPNGDFENSSLTYLRHYIKDAAEVVAVVKLPQETFIPSGTGVKTSVLFLRKKNGSKKNEQVFFAQINKLGYLGNKNASLIYKKDNLGNILKSSKGEPQIDEDISNVISAYSSYKSSGNLESTDDIFVVDKDDINYSRLDFEFYKPSYRKNYQSLIKQGARPLGDLVKIKKTKAKKLRQKDLLVRYVELSDISTQYNEIINSTEQFVHELPSRASYELIEGNLITAVAGNSIGTKSHASAYVTELYDGCVCTNGFRVFEVDEKKVNPYYLLYYLNSSFFLDQVYRFRTGAAIPSLLDNDLQNILVLLPNIAEQERIGDIVEQGFSDRQKYKDLVESIKI
ncbi:MAG: N-6 DNA methylase [Bdellovibrionales bacterium]|nr:N-6 DNA methylase [Bdellovibrionales bacterium]